MVKFALLGAQTGFDISQAFPVGELGEGHTEELIQARKASDMVIATILLNASPKSVHGKMTDNLRKNELPCVHKLIPPESFQEHS